MRIRLEFFPTMLAATLAALVAIRPAGAGAPPSENQELATVPPGSPTAAVEPTMTAADAARLPLGEAVFRGICAGCHGAKGDGKGPEGDRLAKSPRDFTVGRFKIRTTPAGSLPTDDDLIRTIKRGIEPERSMGAFEFLSEAELRAVVAHLKTLSPRWKTEQPKPTIVIPVPPKRTPEMLAAGKLIFGACAACHGATGRGDGPAATAFRDSGGKPLRPVDFHQPDRFIAGSRPEDIYRTIVTGFDGTPMAPIGAGMSEEKRWQIVYYVASLAEEGR